MRPPAAPAGPSEAKMPFGRWVGEVDLGEHRLVAALLEVEQSIERRGGQDPHDAVKPRVGGVR